MLTMRERIACTTDMLVSSKKLASSGLFDENKPIAWASEGKKGKVKI